MFHVQLDERDLPWALNSPDDALLRKHISLKGFRESFILNWPWVLWSNSQQSPCWIISFLLSFIYSFLLPSPLSLPLPVLLSFFPFLPVLLCSREDLWQLGHSARFPPNVPEEQISFFIKLNYTFIPFPWLFAFLHSFLFISADAKSGFHLKWFLTATQTGGRVLTRNPKESTSEELEGP